MEIIKNLPFDIIGIISKNLSLQQFRLIQKVCGIPDRYFQGDIQIKWNKDYQVSIDKYLVLKKRYYLAKFKLKLSGIKVTDVSALGNCHTLDLYSTQVTDVSALGNCHTLDLSSTQVTDVSALGNCHTLDLSGTKVTDVSALGNVHTLDLSRTKISNVSSLGNVVNLYL